MSWIPTIADSMQVTYINLNANKEQAGARQLWGSETYTIDSWAWILEIHTPTHFLGSFLACVCFAAGTADADAVKLYV